MSDPRPKQVRQAEAALIEAMVALEVLHSQIPYYRMGPWRRKIKLLTPELEAQIEVAVDKGRAYMRDYMEG